MYRGLKTYLSKWKGKGFDPDLKKLTEILEAGDVAHAQLLVGLNHSLHSKSK